MSQLHNGEPLTVPRLDCFTEGQVEKALATCEKLLLESRSQIPIRLKRKWAKRFPKDAGVYAVFDKETLVYVGETGSLSARMADFLDSRNHVLRRSLGNAQFKDQEGFQRASARERFPDHIEEQISDYIESRMTVTTVVVPLGRTEIEEHLTGKHVPKYNKKGKRGTKLHGKPNKG